MVTSNDRISNIPQALIRILCDDKPTRIANAFFLFAQTDDNSESVFNAAKHAMEFKLANEIVILEAKKTKGYAGFDSWKKSLVKLGINPKQINGAPLESGVSHNTLTEASAFIAYSKGNHHQCVYVCSPPFHQLRAFMTTVRVAQRQLPQLKIYSQPGRSLPWSHKVIHSQGVLTAYRKDLIEAELIRITKYHQKGDLISIDDTIEYLNTREKEF